MSTILDYFISPEKRLYWGFLLSSIAIAYIFLLIAHKKIDLKCFFSKKYILHPSSILDLKYFILNFLLKTFLFSLVLFSAFEMAVPLLKGLRALTPHFDGFNVSDLTASIIITIFAFVLTDFLRFVLHRFMHRFLWRIHRVHHSAEVLTPLTLFRAHPLEVFLGQIRNLLGQTIILVFMAYFFQGQVALIDIMGVNLFGFVFNLIGSNLRHSHIPISFGFLEHIFISPRMHQLHHSKYQKHYNLNFGTALSCWDKIFNTFKLGLNESIAFGVDELSKDESQSLVFGILAKKEKY